MGINICCVSCNGFCDDVDMHGVFGDGNVKSNG